jgi:hypothetical protein
MKKNGIVAGLLILLVAGTLSAVLPAEAIMVGLSTEELTRDSDVVLRGIVGSVKSVWSEDGKSIVTQAVIAGPQVVRGGYDHGPVIVEYPGGEIGDIGMKVSDVEALKEGEDVILFLKAGRTTPSGHIHHLVGKAQGEYEIGKDGIARKRGFSVAAGAEKIDNDIPADELMDKVRRVP